MRANLILILLLVLACPVENSDAQLLRGRRQQSQPSQSNCPGGVCPVPQQYSQQPAPYGYQNLTPSMAAPAPPVRVQTPPQYEQRQPIVVQTQPVQVQPAQAVVADPPRTHAAAPAAVIDAATKARLDALLKAFEKFSGQEVEIEEPSPTTNDAKQVVDGLGVIEVTHRDGSGKAVATAKIDLSAYVRDQIEGRK